MHMYIVSCGLKCPAARGFILKWLPPDPNSPLLMRLPCSVYDSNRQQSFFVGVTAGLFLGNLVQMYL